MKSIYLSIAILTLLTACGGGDNNTRQGFSVSEFTAEYFNGDILVTSETVTKPAINYASADFHNINSRDFRANWKGVIEAFDTTQTIDIKFDVSWSDVILTIDGVQIDSWSNSNKVISHEFTVGVHDIEIAYQNNWHTTTFNVSFTTNPVLTKATVVDQITPLLDANTQLIYVGAYESGDLYNSSTVTLQNTANKVFLFLSSYSAINWQIENPNSVEIAGIVYGSYAPGSTVTAPAVPAFEVSNFAYGYTDFTAPAADIEQMTGAAPDFSTGEYALTLMPVSVSP